MFTYVHREPANSSAGKQTLGSRSAEMEEALFGAEMKRKWKGNGKERERTWQIYM